MKTVSTCEHMTDETEILRCCLKAETAGMCGSPCERLF